MLVICILTSQQHSSASGSCSDNGTCCHRSNFLSHPRVTYTRTGPTSPSADPITSGAWQDSHWSTNFAASGMTPPGRRCKTHSGIELRSTILEVDAFATRPTRRYQVTERRQVFYCVHNISNVNASFSQIFGYCVHNKNNVNASFSAVFYRS